jgi:HEPN domain-containing protein
MRQADRLMEWLETDEARSRSSRAKRLRFLIKEFGDAECRVFYGDIAVLAFEEARQAYLHGLFVACTLMCQVCVEQMLSGLLRAGGRNDLEHTNFQNMLREARDERLLSTKELATFETLRTWRNPYVHSRPPGSKGTLIRRAFDSNTSPEETVARDARTAMRALMRLCRRSPFAYSFNAKRVQE